MLNPFRAFEAGFRLCEKALNYLMEWNTEAEIASSISQIAQQVIEIVVNIPSMIKWVLLKSGILGFRFYA